MWLSLCGRNCYRIGETVNPLYGILHLPPIHDYTYNAYIGCVMYLAAITRPVVATDEHMLKAMTKPRRRLWACHTVMLAAWLINNIVSIGRPTCVSCCARCKAYTQPR